MMIYSPRLSSAPGARARRVPRLAALGCLWLGAGAMAVGNVAFAAVDINLRLETQLGHHSNLFRQPDQTPPVPRPDLPANPLSTSATGAKVDVSVGVPLASDQTRLLLATQLELNRYNSASDLNHQASRTLAQLNWWFSPLVQTEWQVGHQRSPYPFDDTYPRLDQVSRQWVHGEVQLRITPDLSVPMSIGHNQTRHSDRGAHAGLDVNQRVASVALRYQSPLGNSASVGLLNSTRDYPDRPAGLVGGGADHSKESEWFGTVNWVVSPLTQVNVRLASRQTRQAQFDQRVMLYNLSLGHAVSPFWRVDGSLWNQPAYITDPALASANVQGQRLGITWTPSSKLSATVAWQRSSQTDELLNPDSGRQPLNPVQSGPAFKAVYALDRGWNLFADHASERIRRSNGSSARQSVWHIGVNYSYENAAGAATRNQSTPRSFD